MLCLMICNMTPIPLGQHIASWLLPGDQVLPPRFALVLTPVANGAAVKTTQAVTIKHLTVLSNFCFMGWTEGFSSKNETVVGTSQKGALICHSIITYYMGAKAYKLKTDQNGVKCTRSRMRRATTLHWLSVTALLMHRRNWWRWSRINCQHSVRGAQPQCDACNLEAAVAQGQTSGLGGRGSPPPQLEDGQERTGEGRLGGNTRGSLISVAQMSSWWGLIT